MTPRDHTKTIGIAFGLIGLLMLAGLMMVVWQQLQKPESAGGASSVPWELYLLPLPLLHFLTSYGLFRRRRWARLLALIFCVLYVVIFPLGTALAIYTGSSCIAWKAEHTSVLVTAHKFQSYPA